jgi:glycine/D-amino acid oxidase-like deaminating enzyme
MISFWERESFTQFDFVIIGAGIVGCSTAWHLRKKHPKATIAIIERGVFPSGASTKNAGFACFGSLTELVDDLPKMGKDNLVSLVEKRWLGLKKLRSTLGDNTIDYQNNGGFELIRDQEKPALSQLDGMNELLKTVFEKPVFQNEPKLIEQFGLNKSSIHTIVSNRYEGQIDTGKMMKAWWEICQENKVQFFTGAEVSSIEEANDTVQVGVKSNLTSEHIIFSTRKLAICTNAFAKQWLPAENINPGRGMVMITEPIEGLRIKGVFHYDEGYFYFRNFNNRLLIGGGRNLDIDQETTTDFGINSKIKERILSDIEQMIVPDTSFKIDLVWSGIMGFGENKSPIIKKINGKIAVGVRLGGMGVAIGTQIGDEISVLLAD